MQTFQWFPRHFQAPVVVAFAVLFIFCPFLTFCLLSTSKYCTGSTRERGDVDLGQPINNAMMMSNGRHWGNFLHGPMSRVKSTKVSPRSGPTSQVIPKPCALRTIHHSFIHGCTPSTESTYELVVHTLYDVKIKVT
jgi:hypothetical protein